MNILFLLTEPPTSRLSWHAHDLAHACLTQGHQVRVFFYQDAVNIVNAYRWQNADETPVQHAWQQLGIDLPVCVTAALYRGVTDDQNATRHQIEGHNLATGFRLTGLGELADAMQHADRVIQL